jgi:putative Mg2+ transporter-C (MgtC) family protein
MILINLFSETTLTQLVLLLVAFVLSGVIGVERQRQLKSAGMRTHILVGLGAAVFTLVSVYGFDTVVGSEVMRDPSRIAAQIVTGIGFLGAGLIFVRQNVVNGLTTAASIWVTASIGMACGAGMVALAVFATGFYIIATIVMTPLGRKIPAIDKDQIFLLQYKDNQGILRDILTCATELGYEASLTQTRKIEIPGKSTLVDASMKFRRNKRGPVEDLVERLSEIKGVTSVVVTREERD